MASGITSRTAPPVTRAFWNRVTPDAIIGARQRSQGDTILNSMLELLDRHFAVPRGRECSTPDISNGRYTPKVETIGLHKVLLEPLSDGLQPISQNGQLRINSLPFRWARRQVFQ